MPWSRHEPGWQKPIFRFDVYFLLVYTVYLSYLMIHRYTCERKEKQRDGDTRESYKASQSYARHGRVTTRAAGGATKLLGMGFFSLFVSCSMDEYDETVICEWHGIIGLEELTISWSASLLGELKVDVVRNPIPAVTGREVQVLALHAGPLTFCLCNYTIGDSSNG